MRRKEVATDSGLFSAIPERLIEWEKGGGKNLAVLFVPRFRKGLLKKWLQPRLKRPHMRVTLDEIGTFVWERCDGKKNVGEIAKELEETFGDKVKPAEPRIKLFFHTLYKSQFVRYWKSDSPLPLGERLGEGEKVI